MASNKQQLTIDKLNSILENKKYIKIKKWLPKMINTESGSSNMEVSDFLDWCYNSPELRVMTVPIPDKVVKSCGFDGQLHDISIGSYGPDDAIYDNSAEIRSQVARGNFILNSDGNEPRLLIYGLKKFTGGLGDDDDKNCGDNQTWHRYFTKPIDEVDQVICTQKANGEAAHFSATIINGKYVYAAGSKNVHLVFTSRDEINCYEGGRYRIAQIVCHAVMDLIESITEHQREGLVEFLHHSHSTAIFELLNPLNQHVEDLSHLEKPVLRFITWTRNVITASQSNQTTDLCCVPPHISIELARAFGISTISYKIIPLSEVMNHMKQIRQGYGYEGEVLYFIDGEENVVGLLKKKTIWYILCRAVREKVRAAAFQHKKSPQSFKMDYSVKKIDQRVTEIQQWLGIDDKTIATWKVMGTDFLHWVMKRIDKRKTTEKDVANMFPVVWNQFLTYTKCTDKLEVRWEEDDHL